MHKVSVLRNCKICFLNARSRFNHKWVMKPAFLDVLILKASGGVLDDHTGKCYADRGKAWSDWLPVVTRKWVSVIGPCTDYRPRRTGPKKFRIVGVAQDFIYRTIVAILEVRMANYQVGGQLAQQSPNWMPRLRLYVFSAAIMQQSRK